MKYRPLWIALTLAAGFLSSPPSSAQGMPPNSAARLAEADNRFGFKLFAQLSLQKPGENIFISPASISWAFAMLLNGAEGETLESMRRVLELQEIPVEQGNPGNAELIDSLQKADPQVELSVANSLWGKSGLQFFPAFLEIAQKFYAGKLATLQSAEAVNAWVSEKTKGKISSIVQPSEITPDTILLLLNALYFKGTWEKPFDKAQTRPEPFHLADGKSKTPPMMHQSGRYAYFEDSQMQALRLPYGSGRIQFYVVLPAANLPLRNFLGSFDFQRWQALLKQVEMRPGKISLPRFKVEYTAELVKPLESLGMKLPFTEQAEFKKLAQVPPGWWIKISQVRHKTFVEVNEEGTEAAAVTMIGMRAGGAPPPPQPPFTMVVDRPFLVGIQDQQSGLMLFIGAIYDPQ